MKVTFVLPCFSRRPTGGFRVVYEFANELAVRGYEVTVLHPKRLSGPQPHFEIWRSVRAAVEELATRWTPHWMTIHPKVVMSQVPELSESFMPDADVIFATNVPTARAVAGLDVRKGLKHYLVMDFYPFLASRESLEETWRMGFRIAAISKWLEQLVLAAGVPQQDVTWVSCGISRSHKLRRPIENRRAAISMMFGLANYKAPLDALAAVTMARQQVGEVPVRVFGANTRRRPKEFPPWAEYHFLVPDSHIVDILNSSSIFVSSSLAEGFCLPVAEALSCGCAVAATDCGGIRDFAINGENALLSEPGHPDRLGDNIVRLLRDDELRIRIAHAGHCSAQSITWERAADRLVASFG